MADFIGGMISQSTGSAGDGTDLASSRNKSKRKRKVSHDLAVDIRSSGAITAAGLTIPRERGPAVAEVKINILYILYNSRILRNWGGQQHAVLTDIYVCIQCVHMRWISFIYGVDVPIVR